MQQGNPFDQFDAPAGAVPPPVIMGPPRTATLADIRADRAFDYGVGRDAVVDARTVRNEARADQREARADRREERQIAIDQRKLEQGEKLSEGEAKSTLFYGAALQAEREWKALPGAAQQPVGVAGDAVRAVLPAGWVNSWTSSDRQRAQQAKENFIRASLRLESGAAIGPDEFNRQDRIFYPQSGDTAATLKQKARARQQVIDGFKITAGDGAARVHPVEVPIAPAQAGQPGASAERRDVVVPGALTFNDELPDTIQGKRLTPQQEGELNSFLLTKPSSEAIRAKFASYGIGSISVANADAIADAAAKGGRPNASPVNYDGLDEAEKSALRVRNASIDEKFDDRGDLSTLRTQGFTYGLSDELAGIGGAIGSALAGRDVTAGYTRARDGERVRVEDARDRTGWLGTANEFGGSLLAPTGALSVLGKEAALSARLVEGAKVGGRVGALSGFGYGEGGNSVPSALVGYGVGAGVGALAPIVGAGVNRVVNSPSRTAARVATQADRSAGREVAAAAAAEDVPISRAMVDPTVANKVTGAESTVAGGPIVRRSLNATRDAIEERVTGLSNGTALEAPVVGERITGATTRFIQKSGEASKRLYRRAEQLAGSTKVAPTTSVAEIDGILGTLKETAGVNAKEIAFLETLRGDLSTDLSVGALRRIRSGLRRRISTGDLTFGEDEARVLGIMDAASNDIATGLDAVAPGASAAFREADTAYRQRMEFINGTIQKVIGKRNANLSAEEVSRRFTAMTSPKGDAAGFNKVMALLDPDEAADVAATFASELGRNSKGDFSTAHLVSQAEKMPPAIRRSLFGSDGAESLANLTKLAREHSRVTGLLNNSRSGVAVNFRQWLTGALGIGGGAGVGALAGGTTSAMAGAGVGLATASAAGVRDALTARAVMSPKITKWLAEAPKTSNPAAINRYVDRLNLIAVRNPGLAGEVQAIQQRIAQVANDNAGAMGRSAASSGGEGERDR